MPWTKGESGNPRGRPLGSGRVAQLRSVIAQHVPEIVASLIEAAKRGDIGAARLLLERTIPPLRAEELPVDIQGFAGTRAELVKAIVAAVASGQLDTHRGGHLIAMLEPSELDERISRVERRYSEANDER